MLASLAARTGRELTIVRSDLEFTLAGRGPATPSTTRSPSARCCWPTSSIWAAWPSATSWAALAGGDRYLLRHTPDNPMWAPHGAWGRAFAAAGLHIVLPVGG